MKLYMATESGGCELPLFVTPYLLEMAEKFNVNPEMIRYETHCTSRKDTPFRGRQRGYKFESVEVEEDQ